MPRDIQHPVEGDTVVHQRNLLLEDKAQPFGKGLLPGFPLALTSRLTFEKTRSSPLKNILP
jgi:hypothetical protein